MRVALLRLKTTTDHDEIKAVLCHPKIYEVISCDDSPAPEDYIPDANAIYLLGVVDDKPIGLMIYHQAGGHDWWCHVQVLPKHRKEHANDFGEMVLHWAFENLPNCRKINAQIPVCYPNVVAFAARRRGFERPSASFGFRFEGTNRSSYFKNGFVHDQHYMGLTRWDLLERQ